MFITINLNANGCQVRENDHKVECMCDTPRGVQYAAVSTSKAQWSSAYHYTDQNSACSSGRGTGATGAWYRVAYGVYAMRIRCARAV